ncbi:MAG: hypothetical protein ACC707_05890 [Thiohalomonadales bacterium]
MPQCRSGKRGATLGLLKSIQTLFIMLGLSACNVYELESFALENQDRSENGDYGSGISGGYTSPILVFHHIIQGGRSDMSGITGSLTRFLIGNADEFSFRRPVAVAGTGDYLFIVDAGDRVVFKYNIKKNKLKAIGNVGVQFVGDLGNIFVAKDQSFYMVDSDGKQVFHFSASGDVLNVFSDPANLSRPIDVLVDESNGEILVADGSYSHIVVFNPDGRTLRAIGRRGPQNSRKPGTFRAITNMTLARDGLYVLDRLVLPIQVLANDGRFQYSFGESEQVWPTAIAVSEDQYVFVSDKSDNIIRIYKQGDLLGQVGGGGAALGRYRIITGLWAHDGFLYVADSLNRRIQVLKIQGEKPLPTQLE